MNAHLAAASISLHATVIDAALSTCPDEAARKPAQDSLALLVGIMGKMIHVMSHMDEAAVAQGIVAAEQCHAEGEGAPSSIH